MYCTANTLDNLWFPKGFITGKYKKAVHNHFGLLLWLFLMRFKNVKQAQNNGPRWLKRPLHNASAHPPPTAFRVPNAQSVEEPFFSSWWTGSIQRTFSLSAIWCAGTKKKKNTHTRLTGNGILACHTEGKASNTNASLKQSPFLFLIGHQNSLLDK